MSIQSIKDNSQGLIAKVIVGLIVVTFALFGVDAIIGYSNNNQAAAEVNGEEISEIDLLRATDFYTRQILNNMGESADPDLIDEQAVRTQALEALINRQLMLQAAAEQGMHVSEQRVNQAILATKEFQVGGVFDRNTYEYRLRNMQMAPRDYKAQLTRDYLIQQPQIGLSLSAFITPIEVAQLTRIDRQLRDFSYLVIEADELANDVVISEADSKLYYEANQSDYMTEEMLNVEYIELKRSDYAADIEVDESEIEQSYQQEVEALAGQEERRAAHILIGMDERSATDAEALIDEIQNKLAAGEVFSDLAKTYSDDIGSAENGGDLGYAEKGAYVAPFEEALFALNKGETSEVVETEFGLHLIQLLDVRTPEAPALKDIRERLIEELRFQKAEEAFVAAAEELQNDSFSAGDLLEPAKNQGLTVKTSEFFTRETGEGVASNLKVRRIAFSDELLTQGNNSDLIELSKDHVVIIRAKEHKPSRAKAYEDVADSIKASLIARTAQQNAQKLGEQVLVELRNGKTLKQASEDYGYALVVKKQARRNESSVDPEINRRVFTMPKPAENGLSVASLIQENGDFVVLSVDAVNEGDTNNISEQEQLMVARFLAEQNGRQDLLEFQQGIRANAEVEKF